MPWSKGDLQFLSFPIGACASLSGFITAAWADNVFCLQSQIYLSQVYRFLCLLGINGPTAQPKWQMSCSRFWYSKYEQILTELRTLCRWKVCGVSRNGQHPSTAPSAAHTQRLRPHGGGLFRFHDFSLTAEFHIIVELSHDIRALLWAKDLCIARGWTSRFQLYNSVIKAASGTIGEYSEILRCSPPCYLLPETICLQMVWK